MGDVSRFRSIKQAISYCGLCGEEKSSADTVLRTPLSKQRNKHIQHVLVEARSVERREEHKYRAVAAPEPGYDCTVPEDRICSGELSATGPAAIGEDQTPQNRSRSRTHYRSHLGARDGGRIALPVDQASDQLLRTLRRRKEFRRHGSADTSFETAQQTYSARTGRS